MDVVWKIVGGELLGNVVFCIRYCGVVVFGGVVFWWELGMGIFFFGFGFVIVVWVVGIG